MRIALGGIHIECSTYNPVLTEAEDFTVLRGAGLTAAPYFAFLGDYPATWLPTLHARAVPGGPISRATYEALKAEFIDGLRAALPLDGLYLAMHGAMYVEGMEDAEGDWIGAARAVVGETCIVSASYDLHGNVTQRILDCLDIYSTYRTAPHIDVEATMRRSVSMLVRALTTGEIPHVVWAPIPVVLPGERTSTVDEPARGLYARLPSIDAQPGIWDASLMVGYVWADEPRATAAAIMTGTDHDALVREVETLALAYWEAREQFVFGVEAVSLEAGVARAIASTTRPVVLAESGDNPTGGGVGDRAELLAALVAAGASGVIVAGIVDREATDSAYAAGEGALCRIAVGGSLNPRGSMLFEAEWRVVRLAETDDRRERRAVLRHAGVDLVVTARRRPFHALGDFTSLGLDPRTAKIVAVKSGYLSPDLAQIANPNLLLLSDGAVNQDVERLPRLRKQHPTFPFDRDFAFVPKAAASRRRPRP